MRIQRKWVDPEGRLWYVVRGSRGQTGYPRGARPVAFEEALRRSLRPSPTSATPDPPMTDGPSAEQLEGLLYQARLELGRKSP